MSRLRRAGPQGLVLALALTGMSVTTTGTADARSAAGASSTGSAVLSASHAAGRGANTLIAVSCASGFRCMAVGDAVYSGADLNLAEAWNGRSWRLVPTPSPAGATNSILEGISCTRASSCIAVGLAIISTGATPALAAAWNGHSWRLLRPRAVAGAMLSRLADVSCTSPSWCIAVGGYANAKSGRGYPLAESWNGHSWRLLHAVTVPGAEGVYLTSISCASPSRCVAVGYYISESGHYLPLAESWQGHSWRRLRASPPSGTAGSEFAGVSCTSPSRCIAVGTYTIKSGHSFPLAELRENQSWQALSTPRVSGGALGTVSCLRTGWCLAAGGIRTSLARESGQTELLNRSSWRLLRTPAPRRSKFWALSGLSCVRSTCMAVGLDAQTADTITSTLAEAWNGHSWRVVKTPNG